MKKTTILAFLLSLSLFSCKDIASESNMNRETLITNLLKDKDFQELKIAENDYFAIEKKAIQSSVKVDWNLIKQGHPKSKEESIKLFREAGMKNPEEYINTKLRIMSAMLRLREKYSELKSLNRNDRHNIFKETSNRFKNEQIKNNRILKNNL
jgi:hypothetical protein